MSRERRGTPGRIVSKVIEPRLRLADVLRRRKTTLRAFIDSLGLTTYGALDIMCGRLGVMAPTQEEFDAARPITERVNSPQEGVIVLEAPPVIDEISGKEIDPDAPIAVPGVVVVTDKPVVKPALVKLSAPTEDTQKKNSKK